MLPPYAPSLCFLRMLPPYAPSGGNSHKAEGGHSVATMERVYAPSQALCSLPKHMLPPKLETAMLPP